MRYLLSDWSNLLLHIHDGCCWSEVFVCHFEMFAVGVRCELFPSTREASSYFEEKMATTFGEEKSFDTHFCQWLVSISLHLPSHVIFQPKIPAPRLTRRSWRDRFTFRVELQNNLIGFFFGVKRTLEASSGTIQDAEVCILVIFTRVWLSSQKLSFFVKLWLVLVDSHSCLTVHCKLFNSSSTPFSFHTWVCSLPIFYLFYFQGLSARQEEVKRIHAGRMKIKLRMSF